MPWYIDVVVELDELHEQHCASCNAFSGEDCKQCKIGHIVDFLENKYLGDEPTADVVEVKHGEWKQARYTEANLYICSECDAPEYKKHRYCPNCGADMRGESHETK